MKTIKGDLILTEDTSFDESIEVEGNIIGEDYNLTVRGDIDCWDIDCRDIDCWDINCRDINCNDIKCKDINCNDIKCIDINCWYLKCKNIDCLNLNCWDINCRDINCVDVILCQKFQAKKGAKAKLIIKDRSNIEQKEYDKNGEELNIIKRNEI